MNAAHAHELPSRSGELVLTSDEVAAVERVDEGRAAGIQDREFDSGEDFLAYLEAVIEDPPLSTARNDAPVSHT